MVETIMIVYAQGTYNERVSQTLECFTKHRPDADRFIVIADETVTPDQLQQLRDAGCEVYVHPWEDDFPKMRNHYLAKVQVGDWVIVSDPDEMFNDAFCKDIRKICKAGEKFNVGLFLINSHDIGHEGDKITCNNVSDFFKNLIFRFTVGVQYIGVGEAKNVHEQLDLPRNYNTQQLAMKYWYEHHKFQWEIWERAARNVWIGGGGNNAGEMNQSWIGLREICDQLGLKKWNDARGYFRKGNIDPNLVGWLNTNRKIGFDWENEMVDFWRWYYLYLHPEENVQHLEPITTLPDGHPANIMGKVEGLYMKVLGRHADQPGKEAYTAQVMSGKMTLAEVEKEMQSSPEYKTKCAHIPTKPASPGIAAKWEKMMRVTRKVETGGVGDDRSAVEQLTPRVALFVKHCPPTRFKRVLDEGAGAGVETALLVKEGYEVKGTTFGKDNIDIAKKEYNVDLVEMDMHDLQFPDKSFDAIFTVQVFEHAFASWLAITEARRVLRDGGRVFLDVPSPDYPDILNGIWHTSVLSADQWTALFKKAGFKLVTDEGTVPHNYTLVYEKLPDGNFPSWGYIEYLYR
jgi:SAM-dependent methyltransferase